MTKQELTEEQHKCLKISSTAGIVGVVSMIVTIACFFIRSSKVSQLAKLVKGTYEYQINHVSLESTILTCTILAVIFLIVAISCIALGVFSLYKADVFKKEETK